MRGEVARLREHEDFGLIFERHIPETVRLLTYPIRPGLKVQERVANAGPTWTVTEVEEGEAQLVRQEGSEEIRDAMPVTRLGGA